MLATSSQLYIEYKQDIDYLDTLSTQIQKSHVKGLSTAAWNMDVLQIQVLLDGLVAIPEVTYASVLFQGEKISESGIQSNKNIIKNQRISNMIDETKLSTLGSSIFISVKNTQFSH